MLNQFILWWRKPIAALFVLFALTLPLIAACGGIKHIYEDITMPAYEVEKFNWGVTSGTYSTFGSRAFIREYFGENWMKDSQGNFLAVWALGGDNWGAGTTAIPGGSPSVGRLPKYVRLTYYDYGDGHFYQLNAELPQQKIYELMKQKMLSGASGGIRVRPRYDTFRYGIAPKGFIVLWLTDMFNSQTEVATFQAQVMPDMTVEKYNAGVNGERPSIKMQSRWDWFAEETRRKFPTITPEIVAKFKAGWAPSDAYYKTMRTQYPWNFKLTGNARMGEYTGHFANKEHRQVFAFDMAQDKTKLKAIPEAAELYFYDKKGQRYYLEFRLHDDYERNGEHDLSQMQKAFEALYPNRTAADNEQTFPESEFAHFEINFGEDVTKMSASLVKGDKRIPIHLYRLGIKELPPHKFDEHAPDPTPEQIRMLEFGPQSSFAPSTCKVNELCPQTGMWYSDYLGSVDGLLMRKGQKMPGQSFVAEGVAPDLMIWTLIKPLPHLDG